MIFLEAPGSLQQLILEASQVQIWRSHAICIHVYLNMYRFVRARISILVLKIISGNCRLILEAAGG